MITSWIKIVSVYGIDFCYPCFRVCFLLGIQVSEYAFYYPSFTVCFLLSKFQSMLSTIQVSQYVFYYPSLRVCFLLSIFQSLFSVGYPSFRVCLLLSMFQSMSFKCKQNKSLSKICWRQRFSSILDVNQTHILPAPQSMWFWGKTIHIAQSNK